MNPGLVVKLRPNGPWRIGPDSGARNRVDLIYHSDSLYSAVTSAMARFGWLDEWLDSTARGESPAVSFSSCFPYLGEIAFIVPPRTVWPPISHSTKAASVRWKSARFVPLTVVQSILAGRRLDENQWSVDGASDCLVPAGSPGPFRTAVRWNAAVDRLSGASERHSTACIEFRPGSGMWTVVSFHDEAAHSRWSEPVKSAFRLLADSGLGGERSRGWGRSDAPEFVDGMLPELILPAPEPEVAQASVKAASPVEAMVVDPVGASAGPEVDAEPGLPAEEATPAAAPEEPAAVEATAAVEAEGPAVQEPPSDPEPAPVELPPAGEPEPPVTEPLVEPEPPAQEPPAEPETSNQAPAAVASEPAPVEPESPAEQPAAEPETSTEAPAAVESQPAEAEPGPPAEAPSVQPETSGEAPAAVESEPTPAEPEASAEAPEPPETPTEAPVAAESESAPAEPEPPTEEPPAPPETFTEAPAAVESELAPAIPFTPAPATGPTHAHWLLSLFTPAPADSVDWARGNYTILARSGRVESPAGSGELKKQIQMVTEGSVLYAESAPRGSAADVAPDGFAHPVFRAGFALAIPLPEVR